MLQRSRSRFKLGQQERLLKPAEPPGPNFVAFAPFLAQSINTTVRGLILLYTVIKLNSFQKGRFSLT